ncbi:MAG: hypothetical protein Q4D12_10580 [Bacteroidales bacterium]|nr:hypothetical protein [Bacteroidales bacterium]
MEIYQITYKEYLVLMTQLKEYVKFIINTTPDNTRKMLAIEANKEIEATIATAEAEINLPSCELYNIAKSIVALKTNGNPPIPVVLEAWNKSVVLLQQAADVLMKITDDSYVTTTKDMLAAANV